MKPITIGRKQGVGKIAPVQCVQDDDLELLKIRNNCFLMLILQEGSAYFQIDDLVFEAVAPCFVCFDERHNPEVLKKKEIKCNSVYFHPQFLNTSMTFSRVHSEEPGHIADTHDLLLFKPFTDSERYVFPIYEECAEKVSRLFLSMNEELHEQRDWYWTCRSRSFFIEIILMLERSYGISVQNQAEPVTTRIKKANLKNAVIFIESHYQENIALADITRAASVNHASLTDFFKEELGVTPMEYLWGYRISVAKKHLEYTNLQIKEIAMRCGFKTVQHFSRKFFEYTQATPTEYRNTHLNVRKIRMDILEVVGDDSDDEV